MAQAAGNSCLVCNSLIRSKRRQRDIFEASSTEPGTHVTIRTRVEAVLNLPLEDCGSNFICDKCYTDLQQIEQYYKLVDCFRQRYIIAVQARKKVRAAKGCHDTSSAVASALADLDERVDDNETEFKDEVASDRYDSESAGSVAVEDKVEDSDDEDEEEYTEIFSKIEQPTYEVVGGNDEEAVYSDSGESTYEVAGEVSEAESEVPLPEKKPSSKKKKIHTCPICGVTSSKKKMKVHMKMHADDEPFAANQVSSTLGYNGMTTNGDADSSHHKFECKECGKRFSTRHKLLRHTAYHIGRKPYVCVICDKKFTWSWHLQRHVKTHSYILPFMCCDKTYSGTNELTQHMLLHKDTPTMECGLCKEMFSNKLQLKQHRELIHGKTENKCNICGKVFKRAHKLKVHLLTHTDEKLHQCPQCEQMFKTEAYLKVHIKGHSGENKCEICGKVYTQASSLRIHMNSHTTDEKLHKCSFCGKEFNESHSLKRHMSTHTPEKPHACPDCGKSFMRKDHLTKHMTTHSEHKPHVCPTCGKGFGRLDKMKTHMAIHLRPETPKKPTKRKSETNTSAKTPVKQPSKKKKRGKGKSDAGKGVEEEPNGLTLYPSLYMNSSPEFDTKSGSAASAISEQD